jgi:plasmid maintenance system antidote protein VapI
METEKIVNEILHEPKQAVPTDFRSWLQKEFTQRCKRNPRYSLRAMARLIGMDSSSLSQILSGKRRVSNKLAERLCDRLGASPEVRQIILNQDRQEISPTYQQVTMDAFAIISDWYHYAILELTFTEKFQSDPNWIARTLGITSTEASLAIERLKRLELVREINGVLKKTDVFITNFADGVTGPAHKQLQRQVLQKALDAIDNVPQEVKDITSMTLSIDVEKLPEARKLIKQFRRSLTRFLENGKKTRVYHLGVQLYPVSSPTTNRLEES